MKKFCKKCNLETDRQKDGSCKPCRNAKNVAYREIHGYKTKFCVKCQIETSRGKTGQCKLCKKLKDAEYNLKNFLKIKKQKADYRLLNPLKAKERYIANRIKAIEYSATYRLLNKEKVKLSVAKWREKNPKAHIEHRQNRRSLKILTGGKLSKGLSKKLYKLQKGLCPCCNKILGDDYHMDHIMPLSLGGKNEDSNIQLLRSICNQQKHAKHPVDFMQSRGFLL